MTTITASYYMPSSDDKIAPNDWDCVLGLDPSRHKTATLPLHDCRGHEGDFQLDIDGFEFHAFDTNVDVRADEKAYQEECREFLQRLFPKSTEILFLPLMIRDQPRIRAPFVDTATTFAALKPGRHPPISNTHIDWTADGMPGLCEGVINAERGKQLRREKDAGKRILGLSLWRPLKTVKKDPLAVMRAGSLTKEELRCVKRTVGKDGPEYENRVVIWSENVKRHEWCWLSDQKPNEMTIIKLADTHPPDGGAECCAHTSFVLPDTDDDPEPRESSELRCMVVF